MTDATFAGSLVGEEVTVEIQGNPGTAVTIENYGTGSRPGQVQGVSAVGVAFSLNIGWIPLDSVPAVTSYTVEYREVGAPAWIVASNAVVGTSYTISGLLNDLDYEVQVTAENSQGVGLTPSDIVTGTPNASTPVATIQVRRSSLRVAPEGFNLSVIIGGFDTPGPVAATGTYNPQLHDIHYEWSFGDPGKTYDKPEHILPEHRDANIAYGPLATRVFDTPGTYTITCVVTEPSSGKTATASTDVTVGDPDTLFAGDRTLYVDPDADYSGAPAGAQTFDDLQAAFELTGQATADDEFYRIMLARGQTFTGLTGAQMRSGFKALYMVPAPGAGARPIVQCDAPGGLRLAIFEDQTSHSNIGKLTDFNISGIDFVGSWDSTVEDPVANITNLIIHRTNRCTYLNFHDLTGTGLATFIADQSEPGTNDPATVVSDHVNIVSDTLVTNWQNFAIYMDEWASCGMVGCSFVQDVNARSGGGKGIGHNEHGPIRVHGGQGFNLDACDLFCRNGWFPNILGLHTPQPGIRWAQTSDPTSILNMQRTFVESPGLPLAITALAQDPVALNAIVDKCHFVGGFVAQELIGIQHGGVTIRNSVLIHPDLDRDAIRGGFRARAWVAANLRTDATATAGVAPIRVYNNTLVALGPASSYSGSIPAVILQGTPSFSDVIEENNIRYAPSLGETPHAIDTTVLFPARYTDYRDRFNPVQDAMPNDVAPGGSMFVPYSHFPGNFTRADFTESSADQRYQPELRPGVFQDAANFTFTYSETGLTMNNVGSDTWPAGGARIIVPVMEQPYIRPEYGNGPASLIRGQPTAGSTALGAATGLVAHDDMLGAIRSGSTAVGPYDGAA